MWHEFCTSSYRRADVNDAGKSGGATMFPRNVKCHDCGRISSVRGYGRIEYDWPETAAAGPEATIPTINCVRLTVDCPRCGVKSQNFYPDDSLRAERRLRSSTTTRDGVSSTREVRFQ